MTSPTSTSPTSTSPTSSRKLLRQKVEALLDGLTCGPPIIDLPKLDAVLTEILEGLNKLEYAEIPEIFEPSPGSTKIGPYPAQIRELKIRAVSYVIALVRLDFTYENAYAEIGDAFGLDGGTIKKWRLDIKNQPLNQDSISADQTRLSELVSLSRGRRSSDGTLGPQVADVLEAAKRDGKRSKELVPNGLSKPKSS